ncbi:leucine--tRNA ligase [Alphaproteobacteria bacterium]|nr:leucine--tRNA ligase [Alphaproteobacteria bacterium]
MYDHKKIEEKWQKYWEDNKTFATDNKDKSRPKYYILDMFPYPSGSGLHIGHPEGYTATDILARYKRMKGFNVLHPMGYDSFGLPAERHAERTGEHPSVITAKNCDVFTRQMKRLGFSYDWAREIRTSDPDYYKWTQWIVEVLFDRGLAYEEETTVNWATASKAILSNEEVKDGRYVETGEPVEKRKMRQWILKITAYADKLLEGLDTLDWPESLKTMQREWIGKSFGADVDFKVAGTGDVFTVYTTRPDTLFGATYCVLAPEHPFVARITAPAQKEKVAAYVAAAGRKSAQDRMAIAKEKTGEFLGAYAVNPVNGKEIPIYIADYVLADYGYGAIMAVPAHDERDWDFARKFALPMVEVVAGGDIASVAFADIATGTMVNSGFLDGMSVDDAKKAIIAWLSEKGVGRGTVNYKMRDWIFCRQRYWGEPFPILHLADGTVKTIPLGELPLLLPPLDDYKPTDDGLPPLARATGWVNTVDSATGQPATRELNTMPQWAGSCWYYLRFINPHLDSAAWDAADEKYWMPVDLYVGGTEHAVLHLLYARFWHHVLFDAGLVSTPEPFQRLFNQGKILAYSYQDEAGKYYYPEQVESRDGGWFVKDTGAKVASQIEKMSKSKYNVINPDDIVKAYGADALRMYEMFMGPLDRDKPWQTEGLVGQVRFLKRIWALYADEETGGLSPKISASGGDPAMERELARAVAGVGRDYENLLFNTAIAKMMEFVNAAYKCDKISRAVMESFVLVLAPTMPHLAEELWSLFGHAGTLAYEPWPVADESLLVAAVIDLPVQVNGKMRGAVSVAREASEADALAAASADEKIARHLEGKEIVKKIFVPGRMLNLIVK